MMVTREGLLTARQMLAEAPESGPTRVIREITEPLLDEAETRLDEREQVADFLACWIEHGPPIESLDPTLQGSLLNLIMDFGEEATP